MSVDFVLSFDIRVLDRQTPDVEVIADRDNNGVLNESTDCLQFDE